MSKTFRLLLLDTLLIASDVKFNNSPLEEDKKSKYHKNYNKTELKKKRDEEEYDNEVKIQRHKRLMHLLNKSKFYSSYLMNKIEDKSKENKSKEKRTTRKKNKFLINDENVAPVKKKSKKGDVEKYNIQEYISTEVSNEIWTFG